MTDATWVPAQTAVSLPRRWELRPTGSSSSGGRPPTSTSAGTAEFEVLLTEGSNTLSVIYGATADNGLTAVSGIQQDLTVFTSFSCDEADADTRPACGLHTHRLWKSHADPNGTPSARLRLAYAPSWSAGPDMPTRGRRAGPGIYFPANGRFYAIGGRSADTAGSDFTNPFEYNPATNTWTTKAAAYPDNQVNNMACGVLTVAGTPQIYCVGGSARRRRCDGSRLQLQPRHRHDHRPCS